MYSPPFSDAAASDLAGDQATISNLSEGGLLDSSREPEQKPFALMSAAKEAKMAICMQGDQASAQAVDAPLQKLDNLW